MTDWQLIQSYWQHFYKYQCMQPNSYCQILQDESLDEEEVENLNFDEEKESEKEPGGE